MAKKNTKEKESEEIIVNVEEVYSNAEEFIHKNQIQLLAGIAVIVFIILGYFSYQKFYLAPLEDEAQSQMFVAEQYFQSDSFDIALNGDATYMGFLDIADQYGLTKAGNLAHYYAGISQLRLGQFEEAIENLKKFSSDDVMLNAVALGARGDAHLELGDASEAMNLYEKAAKSNENEFTTPIYLMKAALAAEKLERYDKAVAIYGRLKADFPTSNEGRNADKYLARAQTLLN
ncbi:MAG: tetratricopeptide repeat protein [Flavobacteriales bacterium]|nr:tetratricopeptide repeat protein [Flavobacteriales bacterium]